MKSAARAFFMLFLSGAAVAQIATVFPPQITHVVVIFQENRTPDNLFHFLSPLCPIPSGATGLNACNPSPVTTSCYDVSPCGLSNQLGPATPITLAPIALNSTIDPSHTHKAFEQMCDPDSVTLACRNDGAWQVPPGGNASYSYVDNPSVAYNNAYGMGTTTTLGPYLTLAENYGWANFMYQTNQGPSYPAHQFIFSGTSARTASDDTASTFVAENFLPSGTKAGCLASSTATSQLISPNTGTTCPAGCACYDNNTVKECKIANNPPANDTFCYGHDTMATLLGSANWKYYTPSQGSIWTAPDSFSALCDPVVGGLCTGAPFQTGGNVVIPDQQVLTDIKNCSLAPVTWVIPDGRWSDHGGITDGSGPSWVAAIVNEIGGFQNTCGFWNNTAILITWDDWGGWSDNQPANVLTPVSGPGDYQYGFRVPLLVVSAYTAPHTINNNVHDFGSILRMIEHINGITEGQLGFADQRAANDLRNFFNLTTARTFSVIPAPLDPSYFINFIGAATAPDNDD